MVRYGLFDVILFASFSAGVTGLYDNCTGQIDMIDDGKCDMDNNSIECDYDGGDCCECSCTNDLFYPCGVLGFNCSDLDSLDNAGGCQNRTSSIRTCSSDDSQTWFVNDTASANSLAEAVNCTGGTFNVTWLGSVLVDRMIYIPDRTTLYMTGEGSGAEVNGGGKTRLFMAVGADLHIDGLLLSNGNDTYGGGIAATRSSVVLNRTLCSGNIASSYGGAIYISMSSTLTMEGQIIFTGNRAGRGGGGVAIRLSSTSYSSGATATYFNPAVDEGGFGGAVYVNDHSIVSWDGETSFVNNTAQYGGGLYVYDNSTISWDGEASFVDNTAGICGGVLYVSWDSIVSWDGETSFVHNTANWSGGAYCVDNSIVSWDGETSFVNNTAQYGGGLFVYDNSTISWDGETSFVNNTAQYGGGLFVYDNSTIAWDGETSFVHNTAQYGGGLCVYDYSNVSWDGETSFVNNTAQYGGGLFVYDNSTISWDGETSFVHNTANWSGGSLCVYDYSNVSWGGETSFVDNTAQYGGVLFVYDNSTISWDGETSFVNNTAGISGGVLYVSSDSIVSRHGETSFVHNTAQYGGGLFVYDNSIVSWHGETSFVHNTAGVDGGVLFVFLYSTISWDGETSFVHNMAGIDGGVLFVFLYNTISWDGETSFVNNTASEDAGVLCVTSSSNITIGGDTYFVDNKAAVDGGAAYVYVGYDEISSYFIVGNNSTVLFQGNTCGGNGGAITFIGEVVTRFSLNMTFLGNTARVAGGAIFISGSYIGMVFEGTIFMSNSALIGGGLYSTGSGIAVTKAINGDPEYNPTTLIGCKFIGNEAIKTGGAMDSGAGRDRIVNTDFEGNIASLGGALRLVGTTSLFGCEFVQNLSDEDGGPAISNDGVTTSASNCSFADNAFNCQTGFFLAYNNETGALFDIVCKGCDTQCSGCAVDGEEPICLEELEHSNSTGGNTTLESLLIERGYWRATKTSTDILACYNTEACLGGLTGEQRYCGTGYEGPYCSVCSKGYTAGLGFACNKCSDNAAGDIALVVVMAVVFLFTFVAFLSYMLSGEMEDADQGIVARVTRFIPLQSVKIVIVVWQILTQFSTVANVVFPSVYQRFLDGVDILNFDLSWVLSAGCIIDTDFHDQLFLATLGPLVCITILSCTFVAAKCRTHSSEEARAIVRRKHVSMVLLLTFLIYSSVSSTLFKTFACDHLDDGKNYLRADYRIECNSSKHKFLEIYAGFMVVLYVVGIPAFYGVLLYNNRDTLTKNAGREEDGSVKFITDLWKPYRPDRFYYEVIECVRRVLLTGALVFIYPSTAAQIAVALMMATFFIFVSEALAPCESPWDTWCSRTGHAIVFTSMFLALLLKVDVSGEHARSQRVFELVLVSAHSCLVLVVVVEAIATVMAWRKEVKEDTKPRIRHSLSVCSPGVVSVGTILEDGVPPPL